MKTDFPTVSDNKILIIGNGFDLAFFLPTKYNDFINFVKFIKDEKLENLKFLDLINVLYPESPDLIKNNYNIDNLSISLNKFKLDSIKNELDAQQSDYIRSGYNTIFDNEWLNYFINIKKNNDYLWLDFENEILALLDKLNKFLAEFTNKPIPNEEDLFPFFNISCDSVEFKLLKPVLFSINASIQKNCSCKYIRIEINNEIYLDNNTILEYVYSTLSFFTIILKSYFSDVVNPLIDKIRSSNISLNSYYNFSKCYSFNYTNTPKLLNINNITHLHGSSTNSKRIILGVNLNFFKKDSLLNNMILFSKQYQTLSYIKENFNINNYKETISTFYIWGLSLGAADKFFLDKIINSLHEDKQLKLIIFYHTESAKANYIHKLISYYSYDKLSELIDYEHLAFEKSPLIFKNETSQ